MSDELDAIRARDAHWSPGCEECGEPPGGRHATTAEQCGAAMGLPVCRYPVSHHPYRARSAPVYWAEGEQEGFDRRALLNMLPFIEGDNR